MLLALLISFSQLAIGDVSPLTELQLNQRLRKYQDLVSLEASFTQTKTIKDIDVIVKSQGHLTLKRPEKHAHTVIWQITKPSPMMASMTQDQVKIESGEGSDHTIQVFKMSDLPSGKMAQSMTGLMAWLELDSAELFKIYKVVPEGEAKFSFKPRQEDTSPFKELLLSVDQNGHVKKVNITENSLDTIVLEFGTPKIVYKKK